MRAPRRNFDRLNLCARVQQGARQRSQAATDFKNRIALPDWQPLQKKISERRQMTNHGEAIVVAQKIFRVARPNVEKYFVLNAPVAVKIFFVAGRKIQLDRADELNF